MTPVTREEFDEWLQSSVTRALKASLENQIEEVKTGLLNDVYEYESKAKGMAKAYQNIVELDYEGLFNE
jgi:hypothetical protein